MRDPRDGDGDGWIDEGKPTKRRARPRTRDLPQPWREGYYGRSGQADLVSVDKLARYREYRPDELRNPGNLEALAEDILTNGFREPVMLQVDYSGHAILGEGNHRLAVAEALGLDEIPVRVWVHRGENGRGNLLPKADRERIKAMVDGPDHVNQDQPPSFAFGEPSEMDALWDALDAPEPEPPADDFEVYVTDPIADFADHVGQPWHAESWGEVRIDHDEQMKIAAAYDALPDWDDDARPAYDALISELGEQYRLLTEILGYTVEVVDHDPYPDVQALIADVRDHKRIKVLSTKSTPPGHPYLSDAENDQFRAVHDAFGHAGTGRGFDRHGEEAAYQAHANMFGPLARLALATETRGQNAMLIRSVTETGTATFAPQKFAVLDDIFTKAEGGDPHSPEDLVLGAGHVRHQSLGRHPVHMDADAEEAFVSRRERARTAETKADPRDGDGDGWIDEGKPSRRRALVRPVPRSKILTTMEEARLSVDPNNVYESLCYDSCEAVRPALSALGVTSEMAEGTVRDPSHVYLVDMERGTIYDPTLDQFYRGGRGNRTGDWDASVWGERDDLPSRPRNWRLGPAIIDPDDPFAQHYMTHRADGVDAPYWAKDFDPLQARIPAGKPGGGRWVSKLISSVLDPDSRHEGSAAQKLWGASLDDAFPGGGLTRPAPWPSMARRKDVMDYDPEVVRQALLDPPELTLVDPRDLRATQPSVTRPGVDYYLNDPSYRERGKTYQGDLNAGNRHPFVYIREDGHKLLLAGHHRGVAALLRAEPLEAYVVHGPWGPPRKGVR